MPEHTPSAVFVLSTGRCGTQWLAEIFGEVYGDVLRVEHEPLDDRYASRRMLGLDGLDTLDEKTARPIRAHLAGVETTLETRSYFETGHPVWGCLPFLARRFPGRVKIVHLTRHPVPTAYSWVTHGAYVPPTQPYLPAKEFVTPFDAGVCFPDYREQWPALTPLEKCLYYWAEVQAHGLVWETTLAVPWLRISYESLFAGDGLRQLVDFIGLPEREGLASSRSRPVDQHQFLMAEWTGPELIRRHGRLLEVAEKLGYTMAGLNEEALRRRYLGR